VPELSGLDFIFNMGYNLIEIKLCELSGEYATAEAGLSVLLLINGGYENV